MPSSFQPSVHAPTHLSDESKWFIFRRYDLLVTEAGDNASLPGLEELSDLQIDLSNTHYLGKIQSDSNSITCYSAEVSETTAAPDGMVFLSLRKLYGLVEEMDFSIAGMAVQIVDWERTHQFCGRCATPTQNHSRERAKICPNCGLTNYPRLSPAVIVSVRRTAEDGKSQILLARNHRFPNGMYSVLAGFVEPGESLEECVRREIFEEVGLEVDHIDYFGSQPWPFPHSLMIAFKADYVSGEIVLEEQELQDAQWFGIDTLPSLPSPPSIARQLIDSWRLTSR